MKKILKFIGLSFLVLMSGFLIWAYSHLQDRHPGYTADLKIINHKTNALRVGFSSLPITPEVPDRWTDINNDAEYSTSDGDSFNDGNGNGKYMKPGLTEIIFYPSVQTENLKTIPGSWQQRVRESALLADPVVHRFFQEEEILISNWKEITKRINKRK